VLLSILVRMAVPQITVHLPDQPRNFAVRTVVHRPRLGIGRLSEIVARVDSPLRPDPDDRLHAPQAHKDLIASVPPALGGGALLTLVPGLGHRLQFYQRRLERPLLDLHRLDHHLWLCSAPCWRPKATLGAKNNNGNQRSRPGRVCWLVAVGTPRLRTGLATKRARQE